MSSKIRRGSWMITVPLAAAAVLYLLLVFLPGQRAIGELSQQVNAHEDEVARAADLVLTLQTAERELTLTEKYNRTWQQRIANERELSVVYGRIAALAKSAGVMMTRFDPQAPVVYKTIRRVPLQVGCTGSFGQVCQLLRDLEKLPTVIWVESAKLDNQTGSAKTVQCELTVAVFADNPENSGYAKRGE